MSKRPSKQAIKDMKFPTAPIAKLGLSVQSGKPFHLTETERENAKKSIAELEELKRSGNYPRDKNKSELFDSIHKMLIMSLEFDGKEFIIEPDPDEKYRNKL